MEFKDTEGNDKVYNPSFTEADKLTLEKFVKSHDFNLTMRELHEFGEDEPDSVCIRHDVDHSIEHALKFARWEHARNIRATYFVLHTAFYYTDKLWLYRYLNELIDLGHEIGIHLDTVNEELTPEGVPNYDASAELLETELSKLRNAGFEIVGAAAHGNAKSTHTDLELFEEGRFTLNYFGLEYESYELQRRLNVNYISDNHGEWASPLQKKPHRPAVLLLHPCHWPFDD